MKNTCRSHIVNIRSSVSAVFLCHSFLLVCTVCWYWYSTCVLMPPKLSLLTTLLHVPWFWGVCHAPSWPLLFWADWGLWSLAEHEAGVHPALGTQKCSWVFLYGAKFFIPLETGGIEDFYCIWTEDIPNKLPSFNHLFQSFLYLLIGAFLLWDRMNCQKHFLDFLQNFINSFTGGITLAVSHVAFILSEEIYDFHKSMILKVCRERSTFWIQLWQLMWGWY